MTVAPIKDLITFDDFAKIDIRVEPVNHLALSNADINDCSKN